jgi:hypothetical protein
MSLVPTAQHYPEPGASAFSALCYARKSNTWSHAPGSNESAPLALNMYTMPTIELHIYVSARWKNSCNALAAAKIGQAEIATMIAKNSASSANSKLFSLAKYRRANSRSDRRFVEVFFDLPLITILFTDASLGIPWKTVLLTVITFMAEIRSV